MESVGVIVLALVVAPPIILLLILGKFGRLATKLELAIEKIETLSQLVEALRRERKDAGVLEGGSARAKETPASPAPASAEASAPERAPRAPAFAPPPSTQAATPPILVFRRSPPAPDPARPDGPPKAPPPVQNAPAVARRLETAIGQRWLVRIGALVLVTGIGFFYAYAIEQGWVSPRQRAISGALVGLALVGLGVVFQRRGFVHLAQGFAGCGAGVLFLDVYASHRFYELIDSTTALSLAAVVAFGTGALAFRWSAMALVILAQLGGYACPLILFDLWRDRPDIVLPFVLVLNAGALGVAAVKRWTPVTVVAGIASAGAVYLALDDRASKALIHGWAAAHDVLLLAAVAARAWIGREALPAPHRVLVFVFGIGIAPYAIGCATASEGMIAAVLAGLAFLHASGADVIRGARVKDAFGAEVLRGTGGALLIAAVSKIPAEGIEVPLAFTAAGVVLALAGRLRDSVAFRGAAAIAFTIAAVRHLGSAHGDGTPFLNTHFEAGMIIAAATGAAAHLDRKTRWIGMSGAAIILAIVVSQEATFAIQGTVKDAAARAALVVAGRVLVIATVLVGFASAARRTGRVELGVLTDLAAAIGLGGFAIALRRVEIPAWPLVFANPVFLGVIALPLALLATARIRAATTKAWHSATFAVTGALGGLIACTLEASRFFAQRFPDAVVDAGSAATSVTWAIYAAIVLTVGISKRARLVRLGALALLAVTLAKVAIVDLAELDRLARILSFVALGVVMMCGAWAYHRFGRRIFGGDA